MVYLTSFPATTGESHPFPRATSLPLFHSPNPLAQQLLSLTRPLRTPAPSLPSPRPLGLGPPDFWQRAGIDCFQSHAGWSARQNRQTEGEV